MTPDPVPRTRPAAFVVEDDEHIGQLLKFMLGRSGYEVTLAADGRAAQAHILTQPPPAVALLDVMLPFMDGIALVGLMRGQAGWESVPVIMLTAKAQERDIERALAAGANDYIVKPFQPEELLNRLRRFAAPPAP